MADHTQPPPSAPIAFSYQRFSSPEQAKGDSLRRQDELRDAWLAKSGAVLDTSLVMQDRGVSAFTGTHRDNPDRHALAAFLAEVKAGRVPRGSYLVLESLDRLSREHIRPALTLLLNLIEAGIRVVQLLPVEAVYDENTDAMNLMVAIMELSRGHSESRMKSERVGRAWKEKKRLAAAEKKPLTKALPAWIQLVDGKLALIESRAEAVRRIFALAAGGYGLGVITRKLNIEEVPPIGRAKNWVRSYVNKILTSRATVGEFQPHVGHVGPNRKPEGKPIPGYFPAVIDEDTWHAAQAALASRRNRGGRPSAVVPIFSGLLRDARDGGPLHAMNKGEKSSGPALVPYNASMGVKGAKYVTFGRDVFEAAVLSQLKEINVAAVLPGDNTAADRATVLRGRELDLEERIEKLQAELVKGGTIAPLVEVLRTLESDRQRVAEELAVARRELASPLATALGDCKTLADLVTKAEDANDVRTRLRGALRRAVDSVWCLFVVRGRMRLAAVQMWFAGGARHRDFVIKWAPGQGNAAKQTPATWSVASNAWPAESGEIDLRKREDAQVVEQFLTTVDVEKLFAVIEAK